MYTRYAKANILVQLFILNKIGNIFIYFSFLCLFVNFIQYIAFIPSSIVAYILLLFTRYTTTV